jgi:2,4-didehydro-3-deoxy-L-rhamnonate hydrolase
MKLFRHGPAGKERPGVLLKENDFRDLGAFGEDFGPDFFLSGGISRLRNWINQNPSLCPAIGSRVQRFGPAVSQPSKIICMGLNYSDHALEVGAPVPQEPVIFFKSTTALSGPNDPVIIPKNSHKTDWEVELALVIGKKASYVSESKAMDHLAGYVLHNDYSERAFQMERGGQWVKGKSCDTFAPLGPFLVTPEEIDDVNNLRLWLKVNGQIKQDGNTKNMIFKVPFLISYVSQFMTLLPGDIVSTGTPAGVGLGHKPSPVYLKAGDLVELGIDHLGSSSQALVNWVPAEEN